MRDRGAVAKVAVWVIDSEFLNLMSNNRVVPLAQSKSSHHKEICKLQ